MIPLLSLFGVMVFYVALVWYLSRTLEDPNDQQQH